LIRSEEGLTLETAAFESFYGGQFTLSTQLINPNYLVILPTESTTVSLETYPSTNKQLSSLHCIRQMTNKVVPAGVGADFFPAAPCPAGSGCRLRYSISSFSSKH